MRFLSIEHLKANRRRLAGALDVDAADADAAYREAISNLRGFSAPSHGIAISFEDEAVAKTVRDTGLFDDIFVDVQTSTPAQRDTVLGLVDSAQAHAEGADPLLRALIELTTTDIVVMPSEKSRGGGSGSHLPGVVVVSPGPSWKPSDMAETLVHEATHLNTFVCEMLHELYAEPLDVLARPEVRVLSAVRAGELRPLDKALHSALVAVPLMYMQDRTGVSTLAGLFTESLRECVEGLRQRDEFFTPYGREVVRELGVYADTLDSDLVHAGLRMSDEECLSVAGSAA